MVVCMAENCMKEKDILCNLFKDESLNPFIIKYLDYCLDN